MKYDVFISYRHGGGSVKADLLKAILQQRGYPSNRIFLDTESLGTGDYRPGLDLALEDSMNVIVLVTKDCFVGLEESDSQYLHEIRKSLELKKNIIPIYFDDIQTVAAYELPDSIKDFPRENAVFYSHHYPVASYDRMCSFILKDIKNIWKRIFKYVLAVLAGILIATLGYMCYDYFANQKGRENVVKTLGGLIVSEEPVLVDLGLTSGTLWLDRNIGASSYKEPGDYFAFWETFSRSNYSEKTFNAELFSLDLRKLVPNDYDVAWIKSKGSWVLPTEEQFEELLVECRWEEAEYDGISGRLVTGPNGNAIFFPAAGMKNTQGVQYGNQYGYYWTSTRAEGNDGRYGKELIFAPNPKVENGRVYCGRSVRPVKNSKGDK